MTYIAGILDDVLAAEARERAAAARLDDLIIRAPFDGVSRVSDHACATAGPHALVASAARQPRPETRPENVSADTSA